MVQSILGVICVNPHDFVVPRRCGLGCCFCALLVLGSIAVAVKAHDKASSVEHLCQFVHSAPFEPLAKSQNTGERECV